MLLNFNITSYIQSASGFLFLQSPILLQLQSFLNTGFLPFAKSVNLQWVDCYVRLYQFLNRSISTNSTFQSFGFRVTHHSDLLLPQWGLSYCAALYEAYYHPNRIILPTKVSSSSSSSTTSSTALVIPFNASFIMQQSAAGTTWQPSVINLTSTLLLRYDGNNSVKFTAKTEKGRYFLTKHKLHKVH